MSLLRMHRLVRVLPAIRFPRCAVRSFHATVVGRYNYDRDIYGFRTPRVFEMPDYTNEEKQNRNAQANLVRLVHMYRVHGHRVANLDPLGLTPADHVFQLDPTRYGLSEGTYTLEGILHMDKQQASLQEIMTHLRNVYCGRIGFEFTHIPNLSERKWFATLVESDPVKPLTDGDKKRIFELLTKSEVFDHFMAKRFPQVKRYGLEGAESMMIVLDALFKEANYAGIRDIVLCMPHRGRLNLLTDLLKYNPTALFHKVKGNAEFPDDIPGCGDVLSHLATSVDLSYGAKHPVHVSMLHNPSHLEAANPVALGKARAKQMYLYESGSETDCYIGDRVMCIQMHGDAAFCGQGVVTETLGLANLPHFTAGGSVHVIVNNQIGYTTPAMNARSSYYSSDVAKMISCPVIHVNGDFPEDVARATAIAFEYRNKFRKDVIIDLIAYRRMGHNELDEPAFTQPSMYANIRGRKSVPRLYEEKLMNDKVLGDKQEIETLRTKYFEQLDRHLEDSYSFTPTADTLKGKWSGMTIPRQVISAPQTGVDVEVLKEVGQKSVQTPSGTVVHPRIQKYHVDTRLRKLEDGKGLDWATGEALAFGSLLLEGFPVRISGQDVGRGTFSQRHVMLVDQNTERTTIPLNTLSSSKLEIANSSLSEFAVMGFEYGMSIETPRRLCIWEAQFGDFFNGAQIVVDTFLGSGEAKWLRQSGLVLLLPHGLEGGGPEHSSARVERFLQLCDEGFDGPTENINMHVANPTTPAQYFHLLRRQLHRPYRKPLILATPKSLLRHPLATSTLADMAPGTTFHPVLPDPTAVNPKRVVFVSGRIYYDLIKERAQRGLEGAVAFVRVEEVCPVPWSELRSVVDGYAGVTDWYWLQEEPQNQGAYTFMEPRLNNVLPKGHSLKYHGRPPSAVPATGIGKRYKAEQERVIKGVFDGL
ncbi:oxoglutarate dehydrogenase (succinyl-transferring), E1 component [Spizellomyces punctatus DAOM BR117]|uniref:Oxoglutarate dehydrogenase (Succinyl-transferring), E1 component n=1 Tax=Spizellomyces punctatus (strain DAOM BR117) TaxID=645134 RepID=A0A0L0H5W0_SPIPD|nr:oxoglutarate dehydrogenase (succinyl-transferring), E1 component [Spizellomyces punctatus DAOM BR117]KNC96364.1 oxoglutarate dehydrogenase (succinyl-transferring), E1 component [Spizellomyces punctatus DAOM BR117]|eukprot:XP_016604404.1 oxoglutarate dehydrogenase (succinyl-transferring), E1 component [Spizellomyces punctatus DAOM BR117]